MTYHAGAREVVIRALVPPAEWDTDVRSRYTTQTPRHLNIRKRVPLALPEVMRLLNEHFPSEDDISVGFGQGSQFNPKTSKVVQMRKMLSLRRLYAQTHSRRKPANGSGGR